MLLEKAKALKQTIQKHTEGLAETYTLAKRGNLNKPEERTPLKHIALYAKQPNIKEINKGIESKTNAIKANGQKQTLIYY